MKKEEIEKRVTSLEKSVSELQIKTFANKCGIETEPEYVITKEQILSLNKMRSERLRNDALLSWFPDVFKEDKVELEVGRWYKSGKSLFNHQEGKNSYGFRFGKWQQNNWSTNAEYFDETITEATQEEVTQALTKEAVNRYKVGDFLLSLLTGKVWKVNGNNCYIDNNGFFIFDSIGVFKDGKWAEIIQTITKEDAEKELGKKILN